MENRLQKLISILFLALVAGVPLTQAGLEIAREGRVQLLDLWGPFDPERRRAFEEELRRVSLVRRELVPRYQAALTAAFGRGNERTVMGREDWIYYTDDVELVTGPGVLGPDAAGRRALEVIVDYHERLATRGVELILLPLPNKASSDPQHLQFPAHREPGAVGASGAQRDPDEVFDNPDAEAFLAALEDRGVAVVRVLAPRARGERGPDRFLPRDTHWVPEVMAGTARRIAAEIRARTGAIGADPAGGDEALWRKEPVTVEGDGDLVQMLRLPAGHRPYPPMRVTVERVTSAATGAPFAPDPGARVLLLGDSFTRVFGDSDLGFGDSAGLAEHLAWELQAPVDVIAVVGGAASEVRELLARRPGGLDRVDVVVWQLSFRYLTMDPDQWRTVGLPPAGENAPPPDGGTPPADTDRLEVIAEVVDVSRVPADFDYDFCLAVHRYRVLEVRSGRLDEGPLWVALPAIEDYEATEWTTVRPGDRHRMVLEDVELRHPLEETPWVDDHGAGELILFPVEIERAR